MDQNQLFHQIKPGNKIDGDWYNQRVPSNIIVGDNSVIDSAVVFKQFFSKLPVGLKIGNNVTIRSCSLATEESAIIEIGDYTYMSNASIVCNHKITIGKYVCIAGGVNIVDTDFHPVTAAARLVDTIALSPAGNKNCRPHFISEEVIIEDDVWIGYNATILKGVRIGKGAVVQAGSVVAKNVLAGQVVQGNPARVVKEKI